MSATLGTGGWLTLIEIMSLLRGIHDLSRSGLSPDKRHQASLGALTPAQGACRMKSKYLGFTHISLKTMR